MTPSWERVLGKWAFPTPTPIKALYKIHTDHVILNCARRSCQFSYDKWYKKCRYPYCQWNEMAFFFSDNCLSPIKWRYFSCSNGNVCIKNKLDVYPVITHYLNQRHGSEINPMWVPNLFIPDEIQPEVKKDSIGNINKSTFGACNPGRPRSVYKSNAEYCFWSRNDSRMTLKVKVNDPHCQYQLRESQDAYLVQIWWV